MKLSKLLSTVFAAAITFALAASALAQTQPLKVLHTFSGKWDGGFPVSALIFDSSGNIYGTAQDGGDMNVCDGYGCGLVFKLTPTGTGTWTESSVFRFLSLSTGAFPTGNLLFDPAGSLYGVASQGGNSSNCVLFEVGCGAIFELSPTSTNWKETVRRTFNNGIDGGNMMGGLVADSAGNLYGTTFNGGNLTANACSPYGCGVVFRLSPNGTGGWQETVLYTFSGTTDGNAPAATLIFDAAGNLYGTTSLGGSNNTYCHNFSGCGVVFELSPTASGPWTETVLYTFNGSTDGSSPYAGLTFDATGNLYGTAVHAGNLTDCNSLGCGVIFELSPSGSTWTETVLHTFSDRGDGSYPVSGVIFDPAGNLYGGTVQGGNRGCGSGCGVIFKLSPSSSGWTETVLHSFTGGWDGSAPEAPLTFGPDGNLYGTTAQGGTADQGVVFSIAP